MSSPPPLLIPDEDVRLPPAALLEWQDVCDAVARLMKLIAPADTRIHAKWELQFDIGSTLDLCRVPERDNVVDGVMIGIEAAIPTPIESQKMGGGGRYLQFDWDLTLTIWKLKGYEMGDNEDSSRRRLQKQCRDATVIVMAHRGARALGINRNPAMIQTVGMLRWPNIDVYGFGAGADVEIAQGALDVKMREQLNVP